jgi:hypothetical protein
MHNPKSPFAALLVLGVTALVISGGGLALAQPAEEPGPLRGASVALVCLLPVGALSVLVVGAAALGGYYAVRRLNAQVRVWNAEAARAEALVHEFTLGPDGQEIARLIPAPDGQPLLVKPGVVTQPVTRLDPDATASERLRALAILGQALRGSGGGAPESLALMLGGALRSRVSDRIAPRVRLLDAEEAQQLKAEQA